MNKINFDKHYGFYSSLLMGIVILIGMDIIYKDLVNLMVLIFLIISLFKLLKYLTKKGDNQSLVGCLFSLLVSLLFVFIPNIPLGIIPFLFSLYLLIFSLSNLIMYILF